MAPIDRDPKARFCAGWDSPSLHAVSASHCRNSQSLMSRSRSQRKNRSGLTKRNPFALNQVLNRSRPLNSQEQLEVMLPVRIAFEAIRQGNYSEDDILSLYCAIKIALKFVQANVAELIETCNDAQKSLATTYQHWVESKSTRVLAEQEMGAILTGVEIYESIVKTLTPEEITMLLGSIYPSGDDS